MDALILENVRCFTNPGPAPLAPVTLLVGENSTGKSTFLAMARLASQLSRSPETPDFNEEPFLLGAFDQIANYRGGRAGRADYFIIGLEARTPAKTLKQVESLFSPEGKGLADKIKLTAMFRNRNSQPELYEWSVSSGEYRLSWQPAGPTSEGSLQLTAPSGQITVAGSSLIGFPWQMMSEAHILDYLLEDSLRDRLELRHDGTAPAKEDRRVLADIVRSIGRPSRRDVYASAPIRTEPRRTYELIKDTPRPSGGHVPMILARAYGGSRWESLREALERFGNSSGLFHEVAIKRLGRHESSPFQILIKIAGPSFNLVDVGYGVSQALPIIVDILQGDKGSMFLIQQPEVHLHPKAQAELGTMLGLLAKTEQKRFIVETHSDYLIDRIRMDVRDRKTVKASDVSILYFERRKTDVAIHPLSLDENGNIVGAPPGYRNFFLKEEQRLLGG